MGHLPLPCLIYSSFPPWEPKKGQVFNNPITRAMDDGGDPFRNAHLLVEKNSACLMITLGQFDIAFETHHVIQYFVDLAIKNGDFPEFFVCLQED